MKVIYIITLIFLFTSSLYPQEKDPGTLSTVAQSADNSINHSVTSGETVYSLARKYKTSIHEIYRLNPEATKGIKVGQTLKVPQDYKPAKANITQKLSSDSSSYFTHTVQKGETLYRVARENEISIETLYVINPELKDSALKEGVKLKIPLKKTDSQILPQIKSTTGRAEKIKTIQAIKNITTIENVDTIKAIQALANVEPVQTVEKAKNTYTEHPVALGETIYSLSKKYNVTINELYEANPSVKAKGLVIGMPILIPNTSQNEIQNKTPETKSSESSVQNEETMRIALLLPFNEDGGSIQKEKLIEYYEGFLLGAKDMKAAGLNAEVYTFDTGKEGNTDRLESILETTELKNTDIIIGGTTEKQIDLLSNFSRKIGARYIVPFGIDKDKDIISDNPNLFQMTTPNKTMYPKIAKTFANKFRDDNIIIFTELGSDRNKSDFIDELKNILTEEGIAFKTVTSTLNMLGDLNKSTVSDKNNVIIPTSSSEVTLKKITGILNTIKNKPITLFGYPEWQIYNSLTEQMSKYNTYIYSSFYLDETDKDVQRITHDYKKWYNKVIPYQFPKFAFLGYDTALYFMSGFKKYGSSFDVMIRGFVVPTLQSAVRFERKQLNSGYINTGFYFIHFNQDSSVEKSEYKW